MSTNEFDYYLLYASGVHNSPAIILDDEMDSQEIKLGEPVANNIEVIKLKFWEPYPKEPVMIDFHSNGVIGCISSKIYEVLSSLEINGIQLIPATILNPRNNTIYDKYYYLHIYNLVKCLDMENSLCRVGRIGKVRSISKMRLNAAELEKIPLKERLVFKLEEMFTFQLFHKSVVDAIMATNPEGIRFVKVEDYNVGSAFD